MEFIEFGYIGLFLATFFAATIVPFPSEVTVIGAYSAGMSVAPVLIIATLGNLLGGLTNYFIGYYSHSDYIIKRFKLNEKRIDKWEIRFGKWGAYLGLISWVPIVGDPMVAVLGFFRVKFISLAIMMLIGKFARYLVLTWIYFNVT
ncbi:MAG: DedA family protein [Crocinitomicaceae bacterium]|nr:DedA family protein [Crocinitomicaceae bacterium]